MEIKWGQLRGLNVGENNYYSSIFVKFDGHSMST